MLKGINTNVLTVDQTGPVDYAVVGALASNFFGITTGLYGETQIVGASNIVQDFGGDPYLVFTAVSSTGVPQYRRILLQPWTPPPL